MRVQAVRETSKEMILNKALQYCGMSKHAWYYAKKPRDVLINAEVADKVRKIPPSGPRTEPDVWPHRLQERQAFLQTVKKYSVYIEK